MGSFDSMMVVLRPAGLLLAFFCLAVTSDQLLQNKLKQSLATILTTPHDQIDLAAVIPDELLKITPYLRHLNMKTPVKMPKAVKSVLCNSCVVGMEALADLIYIGASLEKVEKAVIFLCEVLNIEDDQVCEGAVANYAPMFVYIFSQRKISGREACGVLLNDGCGAYEYINEWTVDLPVHPKPDVLPPTPPASDAPSRKVLQISDIHLDLSYTVGASAECGEPICCMTSSGTNENPNDTAKYWGDYRCDLPFWTFKATLDHIKETHGEDFDYIMLTGDYPAHDVWLQSRESNLAHAKKVVDLVTEVFPDKLVVPSMGNHESFPCNMYPTSEMNAEFDPKWLYEPLAEYFSRWLPEEALQQFRKTGFYSFDYNDALTIIGINSNFCLNVNFFNFLSWEDPSSELVWLMEELLIAEKLGKKVHIVSHVPPGNEDCLGAWGREYTKIINRFEAIIMAQFFGHTHNDEFVVFYDHEDKDRAVNIGFVAPSITTFTGLNPAYRIYTVDSGYDEASYRVIDTETYIFDLDEANAGGDSVQPVWTKLYTATKDLGMENLLPESWDKLVKRLVKDDEFYATFFKFFNQDSYGDSLSKYQVLCPLITTSSMDKTKCAELIGPEPTL